MLTPSPRKRKPPHTAPQTLHRDPEGSSQGSRSRAECSSRSLTNYDPPAPKNRSFGSERSRSPRYPSPWFWGRARRPPLWSTELLESSRAPFPRPRSIKLDSCPNFGRVDNRTDCCMHLRPTWRNTQIPIPTGRVLFRREASAQISGASFLSSSRSSPSWLQRPLSAFGFLPKHSSRVPWAGMIVSLAIDR